MSLQKWILDEFEKNHGRIPHGAFVILRSGWATHFRHPDKFFGYFADDEDEEQVFPGKMNKIKFK